MISSRFLLVLCLAPTLLLFATPSCGQSFVYETDYVVEVLAVLDQPTLDYWLQQVGVYSEDRVIEEVTAMFLEINFIYQSFRGNGISIEVRLKDILITPESIFKKKDYLYDNVIDMSVANYAFQSWLLEKNILSWDHAMLFTHADLNGGVLAVASLDAICQTWGQSVVEAGFTYEHVIAAAHELGHSLSLQHDDYYNYWWDCDAEEYVMWFVVIPWSPYRWFFSPCTALALYNKLEKMGSSSCLTETTSKRIVSRRMGEMLTADEFCQRVSGVLVKPELSGDDLCDHLECWDGMYTYFKSSSPEALPCDDGKSCFMGHCVDVE